MLSPLIREKAPKEMDWPDYYFKGLQELHQLKLGDIQITDAPCITKFGNQLFGWRGFDIERSFSDAFNRIDLPIEPY